MICRICNKNVGSKGIQKHLKLLHNIEYKTEYIPKFIKPFYKYKEVQANDLLKEKIANEKGFKLIRFWESDIKKDNSILNNILSYI
jgi:hypothetical protein